MNVLAVLTENLKSGDPVVWSAVLLVSLSAVLCAGYRLLCRVTHVKPQPVIYLRMQILAVLGTLTYLNCRMLMEHYGAARPGLSCLLESGMNAVRAAVAMENIFLLVWDLAPEMAATYSAADHVYFSFLSMLAPALVALVAVTFFRTPMLWIKFYNPFRPRNVLVFSDLNERSLMYAQSLQEENEKQTLCLKEQLKKAATWGEKRKLRREMRQKLVIFCSDEEVPKQGVDALTISHAAILRRSIEELRFLRWRCSMERITFYLVTDDENKKLHQAKLLHDRYGTTGAQIICVSARRGMDYKVDELNAAMKERLKKEAAAKAEKPRPGTVEAIRFDRQWGEIEPGCRAAAAAIRTRYIEVMQEASDLVYINLDKQPLMDKGFYDLLRRQKEDPAYPGRDMRRVEVLVLGVGNIGDEFARSCLWYFQLPDVCVTVTVVDQEQEDKVRSRILRDCPGFDALMAQVGLQGRALLNVKGGTDLRTAALEALLEQKYHKIFICTGDDDLNYEIALRVRRHYLRQPPEWGYPDVRAVIWSDDMTALIGNSASILGNTDSICYYLKDKLNKDASGARKADRYHPECKIGLLGSMKDSLNEETRLRVKALRYHAFYCDADAMISSGDDGSGLYTVSTGDYEGFFSGLEGDRRSNYALAAHGTCKTEWWKGQDKSTDEKKINCLIELAKAEHVRWCVFKLLDGDYPVPDDYAQLFYGGGVPGGRDKVDTVRRYHAVLRPYDTLLALSKDETLTQNQRAGWGGNISTNLKLAFFTLLLDPSGGLSAKDGGILGEAEKEEFGIRNS